MYFFIAVTGTARMRVSGIGPGHTMAPGPTLPLLEFPVASSNSRQAIVTFPLDNGISLTKNITKTGGDGKGRDTGKGKNGGEKEDVRNTGKGRDTTKEF